MCPRKQAKLFSLGLGFISLGYQFVFAKDLTPWFGSTLITWAFLTSATLLAYILGPFLAPYLRRRHGAALLWSLVGIPLLTYAAAGNFLLLTLASYVPYYYALGFACVTFCTLPLTGISSLIPYRITVSSELQKEDTGILYAFCSLGNLLGALSTVFLILPFVHLDIVKWLWVVGLALLLTSHSRPHRVWIAPLLLGLLASSLLKPKLNGAIHSFYDFYGWYSISDETTPEGTQRRLYQAYGGQMGIQGSTNLSDPFLPTDYRPPLIEHLLATKPATVLEVGFGTGNFGMALLRTLPDTQLITFEINPNMVRVAKDYFLWEGHPNQRVVLGDARYLLRSAKTFDVIILDAFTGITGPEHLRTQDFYREITSHLNPSGFVALNLLSQTALYPHDLATLASVYPHLYQIPVSDTQHWVIASLTPQTGLRPLTPTSAEVFTDKLNNIALLSLPQHKTK